MRTYRKQCGWDNKIVAKTLINFEFLDGTDPTAIAHGANLTSLYEIKDEAP